MKRNTVNFCIDFITFLVVFFLMVTGLLVHYVLPLGTSGRRGGVGLRLWGLDRHDYGDIHFCLALALVGLIIVHIWLHWAWVWATAEKLLGTSSCSKGRRAAYGMALLALLLVVVVGGLLWAKSEVQSTIDVVNDAGLEETISSPININGQVTLAQVAEAANMPVEKLIAQLSLPGDIDINERLGRLKQRYGFEINDVRRAVEQDR